MMGKQIDLKEISTYLADSLTRSVKELESSLKSNLSCLQEKYEEEDTEHSRKEKIRQLRSVIFLVEDFLGSLSEDLILESQQCTPAVDSQALCKILGLDDSFENRLSASLLAVSLTLLTMLKDMRCYLTDLQQYSSKPHSKYLDSFSPPSSGIGLQIDTSTEGEDFPNTSLHKGNANA